MNKKTMTVKETRKVISNKVTAGMHVVKKETCEVIGKVQKAASAVNRKSKAAGRAIRS